MATSVVSWWLGSRVESPGERAARAQPPPPTAITAAVRSGVLVDSVAARASVRLSRSQPVTFDGAASEDTPIVTAMPLTVGSQVTAGTLMFEVAGRPVLALPGEFPAYRDILPGIEGPDVRQLQRALWRMGYGTAGDALGVFGPGTQAAVGRLYRRAGYLPWSPSSASPGPSSPPQPTPSQSAASLSPTRSPASGDPPQQQAPPTDIGLRQQEVAFLPELPARVGSLAVKTGARATGVVLTLALGEPIVQADVTATDAVRLKRGQAGTLKAGSDTVPVRVTSVGRTVVNKAGQEAATILLGATVPGALRVGTSYQLQVELRRSSPKDLLVPVTALWTANGTDIRVTVLDGTTRTDVPVEFILAVDGEAAVHPVDGQQLIEGDEVIIGTRGSVPVAVPTP